jgi:hypothetical protein
MNFVRHMAPELSVGLCLLLMSGAILVTFFLSR